MGGAWKQDTVYQRLKALKCICFSLAQIYLLFKEIILFFYVDNVNKACK